MKTPPTPEKVPGPVMPCPECGLNGHSNRIGNRRVGCRTCNNFAARVRRESQRELRAAHESEYYALYREVEREEYESFARTYLLQHPPIEELLAIEAESWGPLPEERVTELLETVRRLTVDVDAED